MTRTYDAIIVGSRIVELAALRERHLENGAVSVNEFQQTGIANVFCAGESTTDASAGRPLTFCWPGVATRPVPNLSSHACESCNSEHDLRT